MPTHSMICNKNIYQIECSNLLSPIARPILLLALGASAAQLSTKAHTLSFHHPQINPCSWGPSENGAESAAIVKESKGTQIPAAFFLETQELGQPGKANLPSIINRGSGGTDTHPSPQLAKFWESPCRTGPLAPGNTKVIFLSPRRRPQNTYQEPRGFHPGLAVQASQTGGRPGHAPSYHQLSGDPDEDLNHSDLSQ